MWTRTRLILCTAFSPGRAVLLVTLQVRQSSVRSYGGAHRAATRHVLLNARGMSWHGPLLLACALFHLIAAIAFLGHTQHSAEGNTLLGLNWRRIGGEPLALSGPRMPAREVDAVGMLSVLCWGTGHALGTGVQVCGTPRTGWAEVRVSANPASTA